MQEWAEVEFVVGEAREDEEFDVVALLKLVEFLLLFGRSGLGGSDGEGWVGGVEELAVEGDAQVAVDDDASGEAFDWDIASGEGGVIGEDGVYADDDGIDAGAELVDEGAGEGVGDPLALAGGGGDFAVEGLGPFGDDEGEVGVESFEVGGVKFAGGGFGESQVDVDAGVAEEGEALAGDLGEGVGHGDVEVFEAGVDECLGAGGCFAVVAAGFEGDVHGEAGGVDVLGAAVVEGVDFGVWAAEVLVVAGGDDLVVADDDGADEGVGFGAALALLGELEGAVHEGLVGHGYTMVGARDDRRKGRAGGGAEKRGERGAERRYDGGETRRGQGRLDGQGMIRSVL